MRVLIRGYKGLLLLLVSDGSPLVHSDMHFVCT